MGDWFPVSFVGGSLDEAQRLVKGWPQEDSSYEVVITGEVWRWRAGKFRLAKDED